MTRLDDLQRRDVPLGPKCYNESKQAALVAGALHGSDPSGSEVQRVAEIDSLLHRLAALRDQCIAGGHSAAHFRLAVLDAMRG